MTIDFSITWEAYVYMVSDVKFNNTVRSDLAFIKYLNRNKTNNIFGYYANV